MKRKSKGDSYISYKMLKDKNGVSPVLGALLIFMIFIVLYTTIQAYQVPAWDKQVEYNHFDSARGDIAKLRSTIEDVATYKTPETWNMKVGVKYPNRAILKNPGPGAAGTLSLEPINVNVSVSVKGSSPSPVNFSYSSLRIRYDLHGIASHPSMIYEHGLLLYSYDGRNYTFEEQPLVSGDEIYVPILNGSARSISEIGTESLRIDPFSSTKTIRDVSSVTITLETNYPDVWKNVTKSVTNLSIVDGNLRLHSDAIREVERPTSPKGSLCAGIIKFKTEVSKPKTGNKTCNTSISLSSNPPAGADGYRNKTLNAYVSYEGDPLPGYNVVFATNSSGANLDPNETKTNYSGYASVNISQEVQGANWYKVYGYAGSAVDYLDVLLNTSSKSWVYQENANNTTCSSGWERWWDHGCPETHDGDWNTYGKAWWLYEVASVTFTYTKPSGATGAKWMVKDEDNTTNLTIPDTCWNYYDNKIKLRAESHNPVGPDWVYWYCYNGSWNKLRTADGGRIYEEGIWWWK